MTAAVRLGAQRDRCQVGGAATDCCWWTADGVVTKTQRADGRRRRAWTDTTNSQHAAQRRPPGGRFVGRRRSGDSSSSAELLLTSDAGREPTMVPPPHHRYIPMTKNARPRKGKASRRVWQQPRASTECPLCWHHNHSSCQATPADGADESRIQLCAAAAGDPVAPQVNAPSPKKQTQAACIAGSQPALERRRSAVSVVRRCLRLVVATRPEPCARAALVSTGAAQPQPRH